MVEKLSITLPENMVGLIKKQVKAGRFASTSEVLREALRHWLRNEEEHDARLEAVRAKVQRSINDPRPSLTTKQVHQRLETLFAKHDPASDT